MRRQHEADKRAVAAARAIAARLADERARAKSLEAAERAAAEAAMTDAEWLAWRRQQRERRSRTVKSCVRQGRKETA